MNVNAEGFYAKCPLPITFNEILCGYIVASLSLMDHEPMNTSHQTQEVILHQMYTHTLNTCDNITIIDVYSNLHLCEYVNHQRG